MYRCFILLILPFCVQFEWWLLGQHYLWEIQIDLMLTRTSFSYVFQHLDETVSCPFNFQKWWHCTYNDISRLLFKHTNVSMAEKFAYFADVPDLQNCHLPNIVFLLIDHKENYTYRAYTQKFIVLLNLLVTKRATILCSLLVSEWQISYKMSYNWRKVKTQRIHRVYKEVWLKCPKKLSGVSQISQ